MSGRKIMTITQCHAVLDALSEQERLRKLTNAELVRECLKTDAADSLIVEEMFDRLDPQWSTRPENEK